MSGTNGEQAAWLGPGGQRMRRMELHLMYTCVQGCQFCSERERMNRFVEYEVTWGRVARVLRDYAEHEIEAVHFTGGEPTLHPRFVDILRLAKKLGLRTSVGTNGAMLCRPELARQAVPLLDEILFSLHGPTAEVHQALTRSPGSFERVLAAIRLSQEVVPGFRPFVNTVLTRANVDCIEQTIALAERRGAALVVVSNPTPEGGAEQCYPDLAIPLEQLGTVLQQLARARRDVILRFFGVPLCLLGEHAILSNDLHWDPRVTVEWNVEPGKVVYGGVFTWTPGRRRVHVQQCEPCTWRGVCPGVFEAYAERWPTDALRPRTSPQGASLLRASDSG